MLLLQLCNQDERNSLSLILLNRKAFVGAVSNLSNLPPDKTLTVKLGKEKPPSIENFDFGADYTIIENPKKMMVSAKLFGAAYSRPEQVRGVVSSSIGPCILPDLTLASSLTRIPWRSEASRR